MATTGPQSTIEERNSLSDSFPQPIVSCWARYNRFNVTWATLERVTVSRDSEGNDNHYRLDVERLRQVKIDAIRRMFVRLRQYCHHMPESIACSGVESQRHKKLSLFMTFLLGCWNNDSFGLVRLLTVQSYGSLSRSELS